MIDRVVQYPGRYQLVLVAGTTDTYDLVPVPGTVTAEGTDLNKANLLTDAAAVGLWASGDRPADPTINDAMVKFADNAQWDGTVGRFIDMQGNELYKITPLLDITTASDAAQVDVDVSGIDFTAYNYVMFVPIMLQTTAGNVYVRLNNHSGASDYYVGSNAHDYLHTIASQEAMAAASDVSRYAEMKIYGKQTRIMSEMKYIYATDTGSTWSGYGTASIIKYAVMVVDDLTAVNFVAASGNILTGSTIKVYGVK